VYFGTDGGGSVPPTNIFNGESLTTNGFSYLMDVNTNYYLQVIPRNSYGAAEACDEIWSFKTMEAISEFPFVEDMESAEVPGLPDLWSSEDLSDMQWISTTDISVSGENAMACAHPDGLIQSEMDNWFISPPFILEEGVMYPVSFQYRNFLPSGEETLRVYWGESPYPEDLNNLLFEAVDFTSSGWIEGDTMMTGVDGMVFFGWHAASTNGYGIFLDDIIIDGTTVGIDEEAEDNPIIYTTGNTIRINAGSEWQGAELAVMNLMGQVIYKGSFNQSADININTGQETGLFIVSMVNDREVFTRKVILTR
jgi:hypothetical protein